MIVYYHGSDTYRLHQALAQRGVPTHSFDLVTAVGRQECERVLKYPSLFAEKFFIVVSNPLVDAETAAATHALLKTYDIASVDTITLCVVSVEPSGRESAASKQLVSYLKKHSSQDVEFLPLTGMALAQWIRDVAQQHGHVLAPAALTDLITRTAGDSWVLSQELSKLFAFSHGTTKPIEVETVRQLVPARHEHDEWELSNALSNKNKRSALSALFRRLQQGTAEQLLLGSLAASIRTLITVKDLAQRGLAASAIAKNAGLHPFVVAKTIRGAAAYTMPELVQALSRLAQLDRASKNGQADATDGMFAVLLSL